MKKLLKFLTVVLVASALALTLVACSDPCKDGHTYGEWTVTKAATCTDKGERTRVCVECDDVQTEEIPALGHVLGTLHPATGICTGGRTLEYYDCTNGCGNKLDADKNVLADINVAPTAHTFGSEIAADPATCDKAGTLAHYECSVCHAKAVKDGDNYVEKTDAELVQAQLAHSWGDEIPQVDATCFSAGTLAHYECSVCHLKAIKDGNDYVVKTDAQLVIAQLAHNCATTVNHCDVCGTNLTEAQILDALFALGTDERLKGTYMLEGIVTATKDYSASFGNITATLQVGDKTVLAYRLACSSEDAVQVGYQIQVTGVLIDYKGTKEFEAGCTFVRTYTDAEKVALDKAAIALGAKYSENFALPLAGDNGTTISWAVKDGADVVTIQDGMAIVTAPSTDTSVTLTATITLNEASDTREFVVTISAAPLLNYVITWTAPEHATLQVSANGGELTSGATLAEGTAVTVVVTPEKGYKFTSYTVNGQTPITVTDNSFVINITIDTALTFLVESKYNVVTIAQFIALANNAQGYQISGVVTNINGTKNYYVQDTNGDAIYVYANNNSTYLEGVEVGKQITIAGNKSIYKGLHQIAPTEILEIADGVLPQPLVLDEATYVALTATDANKLVTLNNVQFVRGTPNESSGFNVTFKIGATEFTVRIETDLVNCSNQIKKLKEGDFLDLVGVNVGWFDGKQIAVTNASQMVVCLHENTTATPAEPATKPCVEHGTAAYWTCNKCGRRFMDEACTIPATEDLLTLPLAAHQYAYVSDNAGQHTGTCSVCNDVVTEACDTNGTNGDGAVCCSKCGYVKVGATYVNVRVTYFVDGESAQDPADLEIIWTDGDLTMQGVVSQLECGKTYHVAFNLNDKYTFESVTIAGTTDTEQKAKYEVVVAAEATEAIEIVVRVNSVVAVEKNTTYVFGSTDTGSTSDVSATNFATKMGNALKQGDTNIFSAASDIYKIYTSSANTDNIKVGSSSYAGKITLNFTKQISKVVINCARYGTDTGTVDVTPTGGTKQSQTKPTTASDLTFTFSTPVDTFTIATSAKRIYIYSITVYYTD